MPPLPFTRREFLGSLAVLSTVSSVPMFLARSAFAAEAAADRQRVGSAPGVPDQRIVVVVQLSGGNDGLNTVVPFGDAAYYRARPRLAIPEGEALRLDDKAAAAAGIGLHPQMGDLRALLDEGLAAVVQGVGYPNPNRSHFTSMDIWHTADPVSGGRGVGWIGKALDQVQASAGAIDATACVCIGGAAPLAAQGRSVKPVSFQKAELFRWSGGDLHPALAAEYDRLNRAASNAPPAAAAGGDQMAFILRTALDAQVASDRIRAAVARGTARPFGAAGPLAEQLRAVAAMIGAGLPTRVYYVSLGGFDTHANQAFQHGRLLREFASAVRAFYGELAAIGARGRVLTLAFSEFGRRVAQNASNGTDHGAAAPVFLFGEPVRPGLLGRHPSLADADLDRGDLAYSLDFRSVYAAVLERWMKLDSAKILGAAFRPADVL